MSQQMMPEQPPKPSLAPDDDLRQQRILNTNEDRAIIGLSVSELKDKLERRLDGLQFEYLEAKLVEQSEGHSLSAVQRQALGTLTAYTIDLQRNFPSVASLSEPDRFTAILDYNYTVARMEGRPTYRCDKSSFPDQDERIGSVFRRFDIDALGWRGVSDSMVPAIVKLVDSIGRIEPDDGSNLNMLGTAFLVSQSDNGHGIVMTNWHVVEAMKDHSIDWGMSDGRIVFTSQFFVDFDGSRSEGAVRARVLGARQHSGPEPCEGNFSGLDLAMLDVDLSPILDSGKGYFELIPIAWNQQHSRTQDLPVVVIGFPARSPVAGTHDGIDWDQLVVDLFGDVRGFKRIAPGLLINPVGTFGQELDPNSWGMGHDASTLKGSSGSPVLAVDGAGAIGVHFRGDDLVVNHAHSLADANEFVSQMLAQ